MDTGVNVVNSNGVNVEILISIHPSVSNISCIYYYHEIIFEEFDNLILLP